MPYFFTSESVSEGHPDKVADQISDALLDHFIAFDSQSKVACETLVTTGQVILSGEVKSETYLDVQHIARQTINDIGYTDDAYQFSGNSCGVISLIHEQSSDINQGVEREKKEDQAFYFLPLLLESFLSTKSITWNESSICLSHISSIVDLFS